MLLTCRVQYDSITLDRWKKLLGMTAAAGLCEYTVRTHLHYN